MKSTVKGARAKDKAYDKAEDKREGKKNADKAESDKMAKKRK